MYSKYVHTVPVPRISASTGTDAAAGSWAGIEAGTDADLGAGTDAGAATIAPMHIAQGCKNPED
jgi:hypothetical protein